MPRRRRSTKQVETLTHKEAKRKNIPTVEHESSLQEADKSPIRVSYERRNKDLDPQLVWRGKDEQDWSDLVVQAPPLYIQEKIHPKAIIDDLKRQAESRGTRRLSNWTCLLISTAWGMPIKPSSTSTNRTGKTA